MTTIACNLREMAGDTRVTCEGIGTDSYSNIKLFVSYGSIYGTRGENCDGQVRGIEWLQDGKIPENRPDPPKDADWQILELSPAGIALYNTWMERDLLLDTCMAIGSGRKVALYCMRVLGMTPAQAVAEACKMDDFSGPPVYVCSLKGLKIHRAPGAKRK